MRPKILIADTDEQSIDNFKHYLGESDYEFRIAGTSSEILKMLSEDVYSLILIEISIKEFDGTELVRELKKIEPKMQILVSSSTHDVKKTVEAIKFGAFDFLEKPYDEAEVFSKVTKAIEKETLTYTIKKLQSKIEGLSYADHIIGKSTAIKEILNKLPVIGESDATVLITGESGTGKEIIARAIHYQSKRALHSFIPVNCGGIPANLMESELFGHIKGAFTGAYETKTGLFKEAHKGSIFLDEVGEIELSIQVKLLRVLQDKKVKPVGDVKEYPVDVRIIAATNKNLEKALEENTFREDLYYRLNVIPLRLPPLRERKEDIPLLAGEFLKKFNEKLNKNIEGFTEKGIEKLMVYHWPGNIRELENKIEYTVIMTSRKVIDADDILISFKKPVDRFNTFKEAKAEFEKEYITTVLKINKGNVKASAEMAGKERKDFYNYLNKYDIKPDNFRE